MHLVFHLARAGWLRWSDALPATRAAPRQVADRAAGAGSPTAAASTSPRRAPRSGSRHTSCATPAEVPGIARPGPRPAGRRLRPADRSRRCSAAAAPRSRGCCATRSSSPASATPTPTRCSTSAQLVAVRPRRASLAEGRSTGLYAALREIAPAAVTAASGKPAKELKDAKRAGMRVHGRTGLAVPRVRRHGARGVVRRLLAAVLPHLPDRRQAARRPADVAAAQVVPTTPSGEKDPRPCPQAAVHAAVGRSVRERRVRGCAP